MSHTKFQASEQIGSEEEDFFKYFSMYFYGLNLGALSWSHLGPCDLDLNILGNRLPGNATYEISSI